MRAFANMYEDYYILKKDIGRLRAGSVFWHNKDDQTCGTPIGVNGTLILCWTPYGDCYSGCGGGTVMFNGSFAQDEELFALVESPFRGFRPGTYTFVVSRDGSVNFKEVYGPSTRYDDCEEDDGK